MSRSIKTAQGGSYDKVGVFSYEAFRRATKNVRKQDKNDCSVIAVAMMLCKFKICKHEWDAYKMASAALAEEGRLFGQGCSYIDIGRALKKLGLSVSPKTPADFIAEYPGRAKNLKHVTTHHPKRFPGVYGKSQYLFFSKTHVSAVIGGKTCDWAAQNSKHVWSIFEISCE